MHKKVFDLQEVDLLEVAFYSLDVPICWTPHEEDRAAVECKPGYVYIAQHGDLFKVGFTSSTKGLLCVRSRINAIRRQTGLPFKFRHALGATCGRGLERYCHHHLRDRFVSHELFRLSEVDYLWLIYLEQFNDAPIEHIHMLPHTPVSARPQRLSTLSV